MFRDRKLLIATKHRKEQVIAPILERELGVICSVVEQFDTDTLGTFTGEVERKLDPIATAREKCLQAMRLQHFDLGVASEGSFGPHPSLYFVHADDEFLIFIDTKNNIEVVVRELSTSTNFNAQLLRSREELAAFARQVHFPEHALILRASKDDFTDVHKGITDFETLENTFERLYATHQAVYAETDMRALYNPMRMRVIEKAAEKLVQKIKSACPDCQMPGFGITDAKRGLVCGECGFPTNSIVSYLYRCQHCGYTKEERYPNGKTTEDPMYCDFCNP